MSTAAATATPRSTGTDLPDYEPPTHPINTQARRALQELIRNNNLAKLKGHFGTAAEVITDNAHAINLTLQERQAYVEKYRNKLERDGDGGDEERTAELERHLEETRARAEKMTQKMDESIRKIIDGEHSVDSLEDGLKAVSAQAVTSSQPVAQSQRSTRHGTQRVVEEDEDEDMPDFDPTDPGATARGTPKAPVFNLTEAFRDHIEQDRDRYQTHSLSERYADNNRYAHFKASLHDGMHPGDDAPPVPHKSTWFNEGNQPAPGETAADGEDSDDDIAVSREKISTKCPLTLREFEDVVTSKKCPHSFEKSAIISLMGGQGARREVQCPVPGCTQRLTPGDLHTDAILVRKIRRIQKSRATQMEEDELATSPVQGRSGRAESVGSDSGEDIDEVERRTQVPVMKQEPRSSRPTGQPNLARGSGVVQQEYEDENGSSEEEEGV